MQQVRFERADYYSFCVTTFCLLLLLAARLLVTPVPTSTAVSFSSFSSFTTLIDGEFDVHWFVCLAIDVYKWGGNTWKLWSTCGACGACGSN
jgi:hypothetical protein